MVGDLGSNPSNASGVLSTMMGVRAILSVGDRGSNGSCRFVIPGSRGGVACWYVDSCVLGLPTLC